LPATLLAASTALSYLYGTICYPLSFASHLRIFTEKACALPCYAYAVCCCNFYLELSTLAAVNKEEKEKEKEK
jgi:hypothetical protein